jgi:phospholipid/cholesterol/gamma-HCH transport system ATP-binding protein
MSSDGSHKQEVVIRITNLSKSFGDLHVLREFSMDLHAGENVVVLGRSGSGKSVLIKCIIGLLSADSGSIQVLGHEVVDLDQHMLDALRVNVGFLFQSNALYDSMTVRENLEFPLRRHLAGITAEDRNQRVGRALEDVGLSHTIDMLPEELSGGMKKRIALARALILQPKIILYDEPTTGLDPITAREINELILQVQKRYHTASIIISHDMHCVRQTANRVIVLHEGSAHAVGTSDVLSTSLDPVVNSFFSES